MKRRAFLSLLPATMAAQGLGLMASGSQAQESRPIARDVHFGDRIAGQKFASRSEVWGLHGACATAHPLASLTGIEILKQGGSAIDAAIAINAALGFLEPISCGMGGDAFVLLYDPKTKSVVGFNGSGRSPRGMSLEHVRSKAINNHIPSYGITSVSVPGAVDTWGQMHARYGKLGFAKLLAPAIELAKTGVPMSQTIGYYLQRNLANFLKPNAGVEETINAQKTFAPSGRTPREGELYKNPDLARSYELIASGGARSFYEGEIAERIERYFKRIGGFMTKEDLKRHRGEFTTPIHTNYRGAEIYGLAPNTQGLSTLQMLNILENFDLRSMGFQSVASLHTQIEAKRLAFEDRAKYFADPDFSKTPIEALLSKDYAKALAAKIRPDRILERIVPYEAPSHGDTTYFTVADNDGMMVSWIQSNYRGMGSGLVADGLGFMFQDRGELFSLKDGSPNIYAPGKRPFHTIIPGFAMKDDKPWLSFGVMGGDMQPQGQTQIIVNSLDYDLGLQECGDSPRWHHEGSSEPTGEEAKGTGILHLESGVPSETSQGLVNLGWVLGASDGGFGGYQAIENRQNTDSRAYGAATEMRKDGQALAY